jgi:hypothetical protein
VRKKQLVGWSKHAQIWGVYTNTRTDGQTRGPLARQITTHRACMTCAWRDVAWVVITP